MSYSSSPESPPPAAALTGLSLPLKDFHELADRELESLMDSLGVLEDTLDDVDITYSVSVYF